MKKIKLKKVVESVKMELIEFYDEVLSNDVSKKLKTFKDIDKDFEGINNLDNLFGVLCDYGFENVEEMVLNVIVK